MIIGLDNETELIAPGKQAPPLACTTISDGTTGRLLHWTEAVPVVRAMLQPGAGHAIVGLNIAFDMCVFGAECPEMLAEIFAAYERNAIEDVGVRQKLIDLADGTLGWGSINGKRTRLKYGLGELTLRHFGLNLEKESPWRKRFGELRPLPLSAWPEEACRYALDDAHAPVHIHRAQAPRVRELVDQHRQTRIEFVLRLMSCWGMITSPEAVAEFERMARENYARLAAVLVEAGLKRPDHGKPGERVEEGARDTKAAMARIVAAYRARGLPVPMTKPGDDGQPSLDEDACIKSGDPLLVTYGRFGSASKTLSNDVPMLKELPRKKGEPRVLRDPRMPIHAHFNGLLETGDIGCSAPNLVNLPTRPGVRECFVPPPGFVILACDYAAIQLRTWAQCCLNILGGSDMAQVLNAGEDPHLMFAADLRRIPYEEAKKLPKKLGAPGSIYFERQCGKVGNFGKPGGMGAERLVASAAEQYQVEITLQQAYEIDEIWRRRWREASMWLDYIRRLTANGRRVQIEQFYSGRLRGGLGFCDAANGIFSALSYDAIKDAAWLVARACYLERSSPLFGSRMVNVIHDELLLYVPEEIAHECAQETSRLMIIGASPWIPDVPPKVEATLMRCWSKKAEPVYREGRLVPWELAA